MDDRQLDDLKQFITATVTTAITQSEKRLEVKIAGLHSELKNDIAELRGELRDELHNEITGLRSELNQEITSLRDELRYETTGLRGEINALRGEMADGFAGIGDIIEETYSQFDAYRTVTNRRLTKLERRAI